MLIVSLLVYWIVDVPDLARAIRSLLGNLRSLRRGSIRRLLPDVGLVYPHIVWQLVRLLLVIVIVQLIRLQLNIAYEIVVVVAIHIFRRFPSLQRLLGRLRTHALYVLALVECFLGRTRILPYH